MQRVRHRSLVRVFEYLAEHDAVVMEAVDGATLDQVLETLASRGERMPVEAVLDIGMELADCLYQAYSTPGADGRPLQLVHRDLKPENVMLTPEGEVKILDFGLARSRRPGQRRDRGVLGTPLYMAPEQALGQIIDHRTDLFAVGLILYEALMGHPAYDIDERVDDPEAEVIERIEAGDLNESLLRLRRSFPEEAAVIERCLKPDRRERCADGHEVMVDLQALHQHARGVALEKFCERFFSTEVPSGGSDRSPSPVRPPRPGSKSAKRRAENMANDKPPRPGAPPRPGGPPRPGAPPRPGGASPRPPAGGAPRPPAGGPPRPPTGGPPRAAGGPPRPGPPGRPSGPPGRPGGPPGRPAGPPGPPRRGPIGPAGGPPSAGPPAPVDPKSLRDSLGSSGARSPDEDGMLEMVRLTDDDDDEDEGAPKSATAFFKIPKSKRKKPSAPVAGRAPGAIGAGAAGAIGGPRPPGGPPPIGGPGGPPPIAGPTGAGMGGGGMIAGPVAGGGPMAISGPTSGGAAAGGAPFQNIEAPDIDSEVSRNRTRSYVTLAIIALMLLFFFSAVAIAGGGVLYWYLTREPEPEPEPEVVVSEGPSEPPSDLIEDVEPTVEIKPREAPRQPTRTRQPAAPKPAPKPAAPAGGLITVNYGAGDIISVTVNCKGYERRERLRGGKAVFPDVPSGVGCGLTFSNFEGASARYSGARAGNTYTCTLIDNQNADCK